MTDPALQLIQSDTAEKWQQILADLITDPKELLEILELDARQNPLSEHGLEEFALKAPRPFVARIRKSDWHDPLLLQIWPDQREALASKVLSKDPLQESRFNAAPGLLHKYQGRVLLTAAPHCAIHCRYCFRRHFDYAANTPGRQQWRQALGQIQQDSSIHEVILSGGDPLAASDRLLAWLIDELGAIDHLTTLRIHTRLPVVIPQRISPPLLELLARTRLRVVLVAHCNHAQELDQAVSGAFSKLAAIGVTLLNQSVLLADVNDNVGALCKLSDTLFAQGVLPYYLHLPDQVAGTSHFQVQEEQGIALVRAMRARMPGYLVPRLAREIPGADSKTLLL
ncbi:MAG: EF-P beta-lysylation protein EpmB [Gammaproteobacteria bacterium]